LELRKALRTNAIKSLITDFTHCWADISTDITDFVRLENSVHQHDLEMAAELYRGNLLDDLWITSEPFREWLENERELWRQRAIAVLSRLSTTATVNADHDTAIGAARRMVYMEPWNEAGQRLLIGALEAGGQRGEAARQYRRCRDTLKKELGIDPDPETIDLAERLFARNRPAPANNAYLIEALAIDRQMMAKLPLRLERIIDTRHVGMKSLETMRDSIKRRLGDEYLAPAPRPQSNGEVGVELRA
jgi:DNA-binding SARP family transcriptional activator